jgi:Ni/Co efflux regulator RcnB
MKRMTLLQTNTLALLLAGLLSGAPALADKGGRHDGGGKHDRGERGYEQKEQRAEHRREHFRDEHRAAIREYYEDRYRSGHRCPPGLKKKQHGCMPPGQARKWKIGHPLPRDVIYYDLPPEVVTRVGPPPPGHRYVRVASDILLIAIGTAMIVDAIDDLGR